MLYDRLFDGIEDLITLPLPKQKKLPIARSPPKQSLVIEPVDPTLTRFEDTLQLPPSPIIFHDWFLQTIYYYFTISEIIQLSGVIRNLIFLTSQVCAAWKKMGRKIISEASCYFQNALQDV